jgi:PAP2 superfamily
MKNIKTNAFWAILALFLLFASCKPDPVVPEVVKIYNSETAVKWADMTLYVIKSTVKNSPTYASRSMAYVGLAMFETVVNGSTMHQSMGGQLADMPTMPKPTAGQTYNWAIAMNAGQAFMIKKMYEHASTTVIAKVDSLAAEVLKTASTGEKQDVIDRSIQYGESVATAIFDWSKTDGGYQGYLYNFPTDYVIPTTPGSWTIPVRGQSTSRIPLHPYWGRNRNFVKVNSLLPLPQIIPHSDDPKSQCYAQFLEVYSKNKTLTQEEKETAVWWSDDPTETSAPPGHSYNLATITVKKAQPDLFKAAETYARTGIAVCDAFINCWRVKYTYVSQRPAPYINSHIEASYIMFWPEPPFPAFMSGHATQGAAAATVLTDLYGLSFKFTDNTHEGRPMNALRGIEYKSRSFNSFWEAAEETAYSRFLGGIHSQSDNAVGLAEGRKIGQNINALNWRK